MGIRKDLYFRARMWVLVYVIGSLPCVVLAQAGYGAITGLVADSSQAVIAGATVTARNVGTGIVYNTQTNSVGVYNLPALPIGTYELTAEAAGFKKYIRSSIVLPVGQVVRIDIALEIGAVTESVQVTAEAPLLSAETSSVATQVSKKMIDSLPLQLGGAIRDPFNFIRLTPGASGSSWDSSIAGGRAHASEQILDGVPVIFDVTLPIATTARPAMDQIAEFRVEAVLPSAEHGRTSGGVVTMVTRSGTNEVHGNLLMLIRNSYFDARPYNAVRPNTTRQGEASGSIGGPLILPKYDGRNRTFFFGNYTGFRRMNVSQARTATVATAAMRAGDFSAVSTPLMDPQTTNAAGRRTQFPGNVIPASRMSPIAKAVQNEVPLPNIPGFADNYVSQTRSGQETDMFLAKIDHQISDSNKFSGSFRFTDYRRDSPSAGLPPAVGTGYRDDPASKHVILNDNHIVRPNLINSLQAGYTRYGNNTRATSLTDSKLNLHIPGAFKAGFPAVRFIGQGFSALGGSDWRFDGDDNYHLLDSLAWTKGKHNHKFGMRLDVFRNNLRVDANQIGTYTYSAVATSDPSVRGSGNSYASFLLGAVHQANMTKATPYGNRSKYFAVYAQDDFKMTRKLTLNYGLRYEFQIPIHEVAGRASRMDPDVPNPGAGGRLGAVVFAGKGPGRTGKNRFVETYKGGIGPRFGLAYQLTSGTVARASYGIYYAPLIGETLTSLGLLPHYGLQGYSSIVAVESQDGGLTPAFVDQAGWPAGVVKLPPFIDPTIANGGATFTSEERSGTLSRTQQWQLGLQQTVGNMLFEASYVATVAHAIGNNRLVNINQVHPQYLSLGPLLTRSITDPSVRAAGFGLPYAGFSGTLAQSLRPFPQYQEIEMLDAPAGNSTYHALFAKVEKRLSHGLQFLASYTISKTLTDVPGFNADGSLRPHPAPQDTFNRRAEKSFANIDIPQRLVLSYVYEMPFGKGKAFAKKGPLSQILGGISVAGIHEYRGGAPLRITIPNSLPIFNGHLRPNRVPNVPIRIGPGRREFRLRNTLSGEIGDRYLNKDAFAMPEPYTFGNLGVYLPNVRGFGNLNEDISVLKRHRIGETRALEFRADLGNAYNRNNPGNPNTDLTSPLFGVVSGGGARSVQFGLRFDF